MDRNIITQADAEKQLQEYLRGAPKGSGGPEAPTPKKRDHWSERLLKYIPSEAIALYLALEGVIRSATLPPPQKRVFLTWCWSSRSRSASCT